MAFSRIEIDSKAWADGFDAAGLARFQEDAFWNFVESCLAHTKPDAYGVRAVDSETVRCAREQLTAVVLDIDECDVAAA